MCFPNFVVVVVGLPFLQKKICCYCALSLSLFSPLCNRVIAPKISSSNLERRGEKEKKLLNKNELTSSSSSSSIIIIKLCKKFQFSTRSKKEEKKN